MCRLRLAMLHYNENSGRFHAETKTGEKVHSILYPNTNLEVIHIVRKLFCINIGITH